jgi:hypothetical protein
MGSIKSSATCSIFAVRVWIWVSFSVMLKE